MTERETQTARVGRLVGQWKGVQATEHRSVVRHKAASVVEWQGLETRIGAPGLVLEMWVLGSEWVVECGKLHLALEAGSTGLSVRGVYEVVKGSMERGGRQVQQAAAGGARERRR